jgi:glutathione S-transferase
MIRLYTFLISHFSEKVRFAFDLARVRYDERALLPGAHVVTIRRIAPATTVPVLVHDGRAVQGSSAILDYAEERLGLGLTPRDAAEAARSRQLEALADDAFGRGVQTFCYDSLLREPATVIALWTQDRSIAWRAAYRVAFPILEGRIRALYRATPRGAAAAKDRFFRALDETDRALEGRPYLAGEAPGRADVTIAALLAPACRPKEHVVRWPRILTPELEAFAREIDGRPTIEHVRRMYREHRRAPA